MANPSLKNEITSQVARLPRELQCQVLQFARALGMASRTGGAGANLTIFAGRIPAEDLNAMSAAITAGCERIDTDEW